MAHTTSGLGEHYSTWLYSTFPDLIRRTLMLALFS